MQSCLRKVAVSTDKAGRPRDGAELPGSVIAVVLVRLPKEQLSRDEAMSDEPFRVTVRGVA